MLPHRHHAKIGRIYEHPIQHSPLKLSVPVTRARGRHGFEVYAIPGMRGDVEDPEIAVMVEGVLVQGRELAA